VIDIILLLFLLRGLFCGEVDRRGFEPTRSSGSTRRSTRLARNRIFGGQQKTKRPISLLPTIIFFYAIGRFRVLPRWWFEEGGELISNQDTRKSQPKGISLQSYLEGIGINYEAYIRTRQAEVKESDSLSRAVNTASAQKSMVEPDLACIAGRSATPVARGIGAQAALPSPLPVFPIESYCDPVSFFSCLDTTLRWQLQKVRVCLGPPVVAGDNWNEHEAVVLPVAVTNGSGITWDNVVLTLKTGDPISIIRQGIWEFSPEKRYIGRMDPGRVYATHFHLVAGEFTGTSKQGKISASISGVPIFSPGRDTREQEYTIFGD
jgi:hypothetical protein